MSIDDDETIVAVAFLGACGTSAVVVDATLE